MSTFLGFPCLRSSTKLAASLQCSSARVAATTAAGEHLTTLLRSRRCFSLLSNSSHGTHSLPPASLLSHITRWQSCPPFSSFTQQKRTLFGRPSGKVTTTEYIRLPKDYKDEVGLPYQEKEGLTREDVVRIFAGLDISPAQADKLLRILHGRRVAGTLEDPSFLENTAMFSQAAIGRALQHLRRTVPVDEVLNAGLRAEDELRQLKIDPETGEVAAEKDAEDGAEAERRKIYGVSILDNIRAQNRARREAEEAAEEEQRKLEEAQAAQNWGGLAEYDPKLHHGLAPEQIKYYEEATSDLEAPPDVPRWRVLLPITTFFIACLSALYLIVSQVELRPGVEVVKGLKDSRIAMGSIVLVNVLVFIAWKRVRLWKFMNRHWILDFVTPRPYQLLTAMTTHLSIGSLMSNSLWLVAGGTLFADEVGPIPFLATFVASGMCGFIVNMYWHVTRGVYAYMMGSSSATFGTVCAYFWLYRFEGFKVLGLPPDPYQGIQGLGIIGIIVTCFSLVPMVRGIAPASQLSHLVGMLTGMGCAALIEKRWKVASEARMLERDGKGETETLGEKKQDDTTA